MERNQTRDELLENYKGIIKEPGDTGPCNDKQVKFNLEDSKKLLMSFKECSSLIMSPLKQKKVTGKIS